MINRLRFLVTLSLLSVAAIACVLALKISGLGSKDVDGLIAEAAKQMPTELAKFSAYMQYLQRRIAYHELMQLSSRFTR